MNQRKAGAMLSYVYLAVTFLIGIIYTPLLLHFLGKNEYGVYSVASSAIAFLAILDLGFSQTMVRYVSRYKALKDREGEEKLNGMFLLLYTGIALLALVVGIILYFNLDVIFKRGFTLVERENLRWIFMILLLNLVLSFPLGIYNSIISANEGFVFLKSMNIFSTILTHGGILLALFMGGKSISMALITTVVSIAIKGVQGIYGTIKYKIRFRFHGFDRAIVKEIMGFSFFIFLNIVIDQLYANTDKFILGALCSSAAVTTYAVGIQFQSYFEQFSTSISGVFMPKITKMITLQDTMDEVSALFVRIGRVQFLLLGFLMGGFILLGREFITLWLGEEQVPAYRIALVVIIPALIPLSQNLGISVLRAMNKHKFRSIIYFFIALVNVVLSIPLALMFGGFGAACATGAATCCGQIATMNWFYYKKTGLDIPAYWKQIVPLILKMAGIVLLSYLAIVFLPHTGIFSGWVGLMIRGFIYMILFAVIGWLSMLNDYEKGLIQSLVKRGKR